MKSMHCKHARLEAAKDNKVVKPDAKKRRKSTPLQEPPTVRLIGTFISLEQRKFFDGAAPATGAEVVQGTITQDQPGIPGTQDEPSTDSTSRGSSDQDALWLSGLFHSVPPDLEKVEGINPAAEVIHLDSTRDGNSIANWDLELKVGLLETQGIITKAGFQKWQSESTYIAYEPASSDLGDGAHEIHSTKLWGQSYSYDSPGWIYRVDRIGLVLSSTFPSGSS